MRVCCSISPIYTFKGVGILLYSHLLQHNDKDAGRIKMQEGRHKKTSLEKYSPVTLLQGFERLACERMLETERKLYILTPLLWPSRCVLFSWCWGPLHRGFPRAPSVGCGFSYHISSLTLWESAGNCIGGFPSAPSVGCGFPYHIWSLAVWKSAGNCFGGFPSAPSVGCGLPYHIWSLGVWNSTGNCSGTQTQLS